MLWRYVVARVGVFRQECPSDLDGCTCPLVMQVVLHFSLTCRRNASWRECVGFAQAGHAGAPQRSEGGPEMMAVQHAASV
jgi:hypothetical protein